MEWLLSPEIWIALLTLTTLEIVLGIDNIVVLAIISNNLPVEQREKARFVGLSLALLMRVGLLFSITWIAGLTQPVFAIYDHDFSGRDLLLLAGGMFLMGKAVREIHESVEEAGRDDSHRPVTSFANAITQIVILDLVFSFDSVITAVGMAREFWVMVAAVIVAMLVMLAASGPIIRFIHAHPTVKMLALSFVLLIGTALVAEGFHFDIPKGYLYFAMAFSVLVESLNVAVARRRKRRRSPAS
jgi:predicted tellurium resistance membrane protein TerC